MRSFGRWAFTVLIVVVVFILTLWLGYRLFGRVLPHAAEADRWVVAAAFATVISGGVAAWIAHWAKTSGVTTDSRDLQVSDTEQNIIAYGSGSSAQGTMHGNIINHPQASDDRGGLSNETHRHRS